jgi:hypothetical protein
MGRLAPTCTCNFAHGMGRGCDILETDSEDTEEDNLDGGSRRIPEK